MDRLYRSRRDRMIAGVAGGVAQALRADPALVRIAWAVLVPLTSGLMLLLYIVMAIVVPVRPEEEAEDVDDADAPREEAARGPRAPGNASVLIGASLIVIGAYFLVRQYLPAIDFGFIWPVILIALGVVLLLGAMRRPAA
jgi:phage shock protein C